MNLYGILGQVVPPFGRIVGQMQHDLFHVYTVDEHILMVIRNLRRFTESQHAHEYPLCSRLIGDFEPKEVLYLAGLFHDIAKGRGGDHSTLGAADARRFCRAHGAAARGRRARRAGSSSTTSSMSSTAQKQDLSDPNVVAAFAERVGTERRLIALYLLTVADIRGTSPKVWNAWKAQLLEDLYHATRARLAGTGGGVTLADSLLARQREAQRLLRLYAVPDGAERALWARARHRLLPAAHGGRDRVARAAPALARGRRGAGRAGAAVARRSRAAGRRLSSRPEAPLRPDQRILRAPRACPSSKPRSTRRGTATRSTRSPCTILRRSDAPYRDAIQIVEFELAQVLKEQRPLEPPTVGRASRHLRHFPLTPEVRIFPDDQGTHFILEIVAGDRPGLLAKIAYTLAQANINIVSAKINTLGERAEDAFLIDGARLHDEHALLRLETALYEQLRLGLQYAGAAVTAALRAPSVEARARPGTPRTDAYSSSGALSGKMMSVYPKRERSRIRIG